MKKCVGILLCMLLIACAVSASAVPGFYLEPASGVRVLYEHDLWKWDYEALGYVYNEVLARHGFHFNQGGKYQEYFSAMEWYRESEHDNDAVYESLSQVEWDNIHKIKNVREQMRQNDSQNERGSSVWDVLEIMNEVSPVSGFKTVHLGKRMNFPVYSGPGEEYERAGGGKAEVSTQEAIFCAGYVGDWLYVLYETENGTMRTGYISYPYELFGVSELVFENKIASVAEESLITEDPFTGKTEKRILRKGQGVTYLGCIDSARKWAYVECAYKSALVRGYVPFEAVQIFDCGELECSDNEFGIVINAYKGSKTDIVFPEQINGKQVIGLGRRMMGSSEVNRRYDVETVYVPDSVRYIDERAFCRCMNLQSIRLPRNLMRIESGAFFGCMNLTNIDTTEMPNIIRGNAFAHCLGLTDLKMPSGKVQFGDAAFANTKVRMIVGKGSDAERYAKEKGISYIYESDYREEQAGK